MSKRNTLIVVLIADDEIFGFGEGTPYFTSSYEDYKKIRNLAKVFIGLSLEESLHKLEELELREIKLSRRVHYGAYLALSCSIIDALARCSGKSITNILGQSYRSKIPVAGTIFLKHPVKMGEELENWIRKGVKHIKFKIPDSLYDLEVQLRTFSNILSVLNARDVVLRADVNQCYNSFEKAFKALKIMEKFGVAIVEQPMPKRSLMAIARLRKKFTPTLKIMLDESLETPKDIEKFAVLEAADIINFHPPKLGCLTITRETMLKATRLGLEVNIGSSLMTEVGLTHYLNLAASIPKLNYPLEEIGLLNLYGYVISKSSEEFIITKNGTIRVPNNAPVLHGETIKKIQKPKQTIFCKITTELIRKLEHMLEIIGVKL